MKRPILTFGIGYIIGIIWGLYCKRSIALLYIFIFTIILLKKKMIKSKRKFKLISISRYSRYVKLFLKSNVTIILISSIISNTIIIYLNQKYQKFYLNTPESIKIIGTVVSNKEEKEYNYIYKIRLDKIIQKSKEEKPINTFLYLNIKIKENYNLEYGDKIFVEGKYEKPNVQRNYKGFDYCRYLKQEKIYGKITPSKIHILYKNSYNKIQTYSNNCFLSIKQKIEENYSGRFKELLLGITLGDKQDISEELKKDFENSNISHILAISGMHINFIVLMLMFILKHIIGKRKSSIVISIILIIYMFISGLSPSIVRATIMGIVLLFSSVVHRKNDIWSSISFSLLVILIYNPFLIENVGLQLSYIGTIGIICLNKTLNSLTIKIPKYLRELIVIMLSAQIAILPIMIINFNTIGISFFITNILASIIICPIVILGFIQVLMFFINDFLALIVQKILEPLFHILILISKLGTKLPLNKIYVGTPNILLIILYYLIIIVIVQIYKIYTVKHKTTTQIRIKNLINLAKYKIIQNKKKVIVILLIVFMSLTVFKLYPKDLKINFIDVGQGDSCLIQTPLGKKILIDGGGSSFDKYTVGEKTTLPYLLDRGITKLDYVIISHFDSDHVGGILVILQNLKVENVIISKQYENTENFEEFYKIVNEKNISVKYVKAGNIINLEKNLSIHILFPIEKQIGENPINNNSIVFKLIYKEFTMLFTGDIEEIAEEKLVNLYKNNLKSDILKVAHHGSSSSSTEDFLKCVRPQIALIGVGENNLYGHPSSSVIDRFKNINTQVYRTDLDGEIEIIISNKIEINKHID